MRDVKSVGGAARERESLFCCCSLSSFVFRVASTALCVAEYLLMSKAIAYAIHCGDWRNVGGIGRGEDYR